MHSSNIGAQTATVDQLPLYRRKIFVPGVLAGAVLLALTGTYLSTANQAMATMQSSPTVQPEVFAGPPSFAGIAEQVTPAVVNVAVIQQVEAGPHPQMEIPSFPEGSPFSEFFRRHFQQGSPLPQGFDVPRHAQGQGSGFIIDPDGHVVTNNHVVENATEVEVVLNDGTRHQARVKGRDSKTDLALLKIDTDKPLPFVKLGNSEQARVGDWVLAVGNPFGLGGSVSAGIISARGRDIHSGPYDDYLQIDAPINRGNSGGPLFDASGRVIGINTAIYSPSGGNVGIGFAIPAAAAETVVAALLEHGRVKRGWLGVQIQPVTEEIAAALGRDDRQGALVAEVMPNSPAAAAGLRAGDLILSLNANPVREIKDLSRVVAEIVAGTKVDIGIQRNGSNASIDLTIGEMPMEETVAAAPDPGVKSSEPRLGLYLAPLTPEFRQTKGLGTGARGVVVTGVEKESGAEKAGIRPGSLITMVGQQEVSTPDEAASQVRKAIGGGDRTVLLRIVQNGKARFVAVKPAA